MRTSVLLGFLLLFIVGAAPAQNQSAEEAAGADEVRADNRNQEETTRKPPAQFIPKEKISPDQVISFPADI